jgi:hypothetical protein
MKKYLISIVLAGVVIPVFWLFNRPLNVTQLPSAQPLTPALPLIQNTHTVPHANAAQAEEPAVDEVILPEDLDQEAIASMAQARAAGDNRAPDVHASTARSAPAADVIADETAYANYETTQQKKMYRAYVEAALPKVRELQALVDKAKQQGDIPAEQIQEAEDKIAGILAMREQLMRENPDLMAPEYASTASVVGDTNVPLNGAGL